MKARVVVKGVLFIASLAALGYAFRHSDLGHALTTAWIDANVRGHGLGGELLFLAMGGVLTALGLPRQIVAFLGGYAFGVAQGTLLGVTAAVLGCALAFAYARLFGRALLRTRLGTRAERFDRFIQNHPVTMTILVRLLPVGSNLATNLVAGLSGIRLWPFLAGSFIGYLPQTLAFALVGSGAHLAPTVKFSLAIALFLISGALGAYLYHRFRHGVSLDDQIDRELDETVATPYETSRS